MRRAPTAAAPKPARGIYRANVCVGGFELYYALTSDGAPIGPRFVTADEPEYQVIAELAEELERRDPARRTHLRLVRDAG